MRHDIDSQNSHFESEEAAPVASAPRGASSSPKAREIGSGLALFVHGTPGTASDWSPVLESLDSLGFVCETVSPDRPGFGSSLDHRKAEDFEVQLDYLQSKLEERGAGSRPLVLVGHSYGAALILGLADRLKASSLDIGLVLISGVLSPESKQCRWYHRALQLPVVSLFAPAKYVQASKEMSAISPRLEELADVWAAFESPVTLLHGDEDRLIPLENSQFAQSRMQEGRCRLVIVEGGGHSLTKTHPVEIAAEIVQLFDQLAGEEGTRER